MYSVDSPAPNMSNSMLANSPISDNYLIKWNKIAGSIHCVQGLLMFGAAIAVPGVKDFSLPLTLRYQQFDNATRSLTNGETALGEVQVGFFVPVFLLLSAAAHFIVVWKREEYIAGINRSVNIFRWYEYALSSSVMIWAIAMFFGVQDLATLILIFSTNASMNLFGLLMETGNEREQGEPLKTWAPFWFGCWAGVPPWLVIIMYFVGGPSVAEVPGFVYGILASYAFFFNTFPVNMVLQYKKIGKWADYRYGEMGYIVLSLLSKSLLAWLVFGGTFQPNGDEE